MSTLKPVATSPAQVTNATPAASAPPPLTDSLQKGAKPTIAQQPLTVVVAKMPEEKTDFTGDLVSGGIGTVSTLAGVLITLWLTNRQKDREDRKKVDDYCFDSYKKISTIYQFSLRFIEHFNKGVSDAKTANAEFISLHIQPYANLPEEISFSRDEISALRKVSKLDIIDNIFDVEGKYRAAIQAMISYRSKIEEIQRIATVENSNGEIATVTFKPEMMGRIKAEYGMLDRSARTINDICKNNAESCFMVLKILIEAMAIYFKRYQGISIIDPQGKPVKFEFNTKMKRESGRRN